MKTTFFGVCVFARLFRSIFFTLMNGINLSCWVCPVGFYQGSVYITFAYFYLLLQISPKHNGVHMALAGSQWSKSN